MSLIDRINANPLPFAQLLGIEFMSVEADALAARMVIRPELCTIGGIAHGGAIMSFADTLGAAAAFINLPADAKGTTTIESKTNFVAAAPAGSTVIGRTTPRPSRQEDPGVANPRRNRRREARRAHRADADESLSGRPPTRRPNPSKQIQMNGRRDRAGMGRASRRWSEWPLVNRSQIAASAAVKKLVPTSPSRLRAALPGAMASKA